MLDEEAHLEHVDEDKRLRLTQKKEKEAKRKAQEESNYLKREDRKNFEKPVLEWMKTRVICSLETTSITKSMPIIAIEARGGNQEKMFPFKA